MVRQPGDAGYERGAWLVTAARGRGFTTLPARMQEVQTVRRFTVPLTSARSFWMFGFHHRLVRRWEWLTFMPVDGRLPQISQIADIAHLARARLLMARLLMAHAGDSERLDVRSGTGSVCRKPVGVRFGDAGRSPSRLAS